MADLDCRAMCAELIDAYAWCIDAFMTAPAEEDTLIQRARALLAQPEPEGPTDEEIYKLALEKDFLVDVGDGFSCMVQDEVEFARAVLARWGHPTLQPVAVSERLPSAADCDVEDNCWWFDPHADGAWYVDTFQSCYTHWLPANALPTPEAQ